jgi:K+-transporting ATPase c subunit
MNQQETAVQVIRNLKTKRSVLSSDIANKQQIINKIDEILSNIKDVVMERMRSKNKMSGGGTKLDELTKKLVESVKEYLKEIEKLEGTETASDLPLAEFLTESASGDLSDVIDELGEEINSMEIKSMTGGKKRKMKKTKKINKKSKKTKKINKKSKKTKKINKKSRK